jgi:hypothetical protein
MHDCDLYNDKHLNNNPREMWDFRTARHRISPGRCITVVVKLESDTEEISFFNSNPT